MDSALQPTLPADVQAAPAAPPAHPAVRKWLLVAAAWTLVGLLAACQTGLAQIYAGQPVAWGPLFLSYLAD